MTDAAAPRPMRNYLDFEKPIAELEGKIEELRHLAGNGELNIAEEVAKLQGKVERQLKLTYAKLTAWQKVQVARHPDRPHAVDYVKGLITDWTPLAGDRCFAEDRAVLSGLGRLGGYSVMVLGTEKGNTTETRVRHSFGAARPEGYRKARRLIELADRFGVPVLTLIDTSGAYPGVEAEERGQAEAIARSIDACLGARVPIIAVVIGEGGSGGAMALAAADRLLMLEHSIFSVISPEGCASILWRSGDHAATAAEALKLTAKDMLKFGIVDEVVEEPLGGAHRDKLATVKLVGERIEAALRDLRTIDGGRLRARRRERFLETASAVG